jgi:shikimate dehydrogenase
VAACRAAGGEVAVANRTERPGLVQLGSDKCLALAREADLVVNATTVGLRGEDPCVIDPDVFRAGQLVYDLIPVARETATLAAARAAGARTLDGLGMLAAQAAESFRIWTGCTADMAAMLAALGR